VIHAKVSGVLVKDVEVIVEICDGRIEVVENNVGKDAMQELIEDKISIVT